MKTDRCCRNKMQAAEFGFTYSPQKTADPGVKCEFIELWRLAGGCFRERSLPRLRPCAFPCPQLPLSVAGGSVHLLRLRDGDADPWLVCAGRDAVGADADDLCVDAASGHAAVADVRGDGRPDRPAQASVLDARVLRLAGGQHHGAGARGPAQPLCGAGHRGRHGHGQAIGYRHALGAGRRDGAASAIDGRDERAADHAGYGAHRRRAERRGADGMAGHGLGLCRRDLPLPRQLPADAADRRGAGRSCRQARAAIAVARPEGRARLCRHHALPAGDDDPRLPPEHDGVSADQQPVALCGEGRLRRRPEDARDADCLRRAWRGDRLDPDHPVRQLCSGLHG